MKPPLHTKTREAELELKKRLQMCSSSKLPMSAEHVVHIHGWQSFFTNFSRLFFDEHKQEAAATSRQTNDSKAEESLKSLVKSRTAESFEFSPVRSSQRSSKSLAWWTTETPEPAVDLCMETEEAQPGTGIFIVSLQEAEAEHSEEDSLC